MAYFDSNAAYAYEYQAQAYSEPVRRERLEERPAQRPRLDVVPGAGREANQAVSPVFTHVVKVFAALVLLFVSIGLARVAIAGYTTSMLNANAELSSSLEAARDESSNLEVMNSVYGADTRIRDLATGALGMVEPEDSITIDLSDPADAAQGEASAANGQDAAQGSARTPRRAALPLRIDNDREATYGTRPVHRGTRPGRTPSKRCWFPPGDGRIRGRRAPGRIRARGLCAPSRHLAPYLAR